LEGDLNAPLVPILRCELAAPPPAQAAWGPIQPGLECLQGWGICSFSGQLCQGLTTINDFLLIPNLNLPYFNLKLFLM